MKLRRLKNLRERLRAAEALEQAELYESHHGRWADLARPTQLAPAGDWYIWLILAGRGWGKTLTGANWLKEQIEQNPGARWAMVGATFADMRDTMVEGVSGLLSVLPPSMLIGGSVDRSWNRSMGQLKLADGTKVQGFTSEKPGRLRGPEVFGVWGDEPAEWRDADVVTDEGEIAQGTTWDNIQFINRAGPNPQVCMTGTPKNVALIRHLLFVDGRRRNGPRDDVVVTRGRTDENLANLSPRYKKNVVDRYRGTRLGRQELDAELLEDVEGALWKPGSIIHVTVLPELVRVIEGVDPSGAAKGAECGIVFAGLGVDGYIYVSADYSLRGSPGEWSRAVVHSYQDEEADRIAVERNYGGDMVKHTIVTVPAEDGYLSGEFIPVKEITASRGKQLRAEPVVNVYEQRRVRHFGAFPELEDQMTTWIPAESKWSPDRLDAAVFAISELLFGEHEPSDEEGDDEDEFEISRY